MNARKKMIITGAGGFIGSALAKHFQNKEWQVIAFVHSVPQKPIQDVVYVKYDMSGIPDEGAFDEAGVLIHCAYIKNDLQTNISGTKKLIECSRKYKLKKNIFLSSFSALENAVSIYGKQKLEVEKLFNTGKDCSIRAGVVLGEGGLFKQMSEHIRKGKRIPLIDGGRQPFQTIHIDDLVTIIDKIVENNLSGKFTVAEPETVPYKEFFSALGEKLNARAKFVRIPYFLLNFVLFIAETLHIKLPVARENVLGLKFMKARETKADLEKLGVRICSYKESLDRMLL